MSHKYIGICICIFTEFEPSRSLWGQLLFLPAILNIRKSPVAEGVTVVNVCIAPSCPMDAIPYRCTSRKTVVYKANIF